MGIIKKKLWQNFIKAEIEEVIEVEETETVAVIKEVTTIEMKGTIVTTEELHSKEKGVMTEDMTTDLPKTPMEFKKEMTTLKGEMIETGEMEETVKMVEVVEIGEEMRTGYLETK